MGVYINMEMPENCWSCRMFYNCYACEDHYCRCAALDEVIGKDDKVLRNKRRDDCPLIHILPHMRLIDANALLSKDRQIYRRDGAAIGVRRYIEFSEIEDAPTIIPTEGE